MGIPLFPLVEAGYSSTAIGPPLAAAFIGSQRERRHGGAFEFPRKGPSHHGSACRRAAGGQGADSEWQAAVAEEKNPCAPFDEFGTEQCRGEGAAGGAKNEGIRTGDRVNELGACRARGKGPEAAVCTEAVARFRAGGIAAAALFEPPGPAARSVPVAKLRVVAATPLWFDSGWLPTHSRQMAWSTADDGPDWTYFFEPSAGKPFAEADVRSLWFVAMGTRAAQGFGRVAAEVWSAARILP